MCILILIKNKGGCGIYERMCIEVLKEELAWAIDKRLQIISNIMSVIYTTKKLENSYIKFKTTLYVLVYVVLSNIF